jgi:hypothetical protein
MLTIYIAAAVALALVLALLVAILRKLDGLPPRLWGIAQRERAREESTALEVLTDGTRARVTTIVAGLRAYEEQVAAAWREQMGGAETRARIAERRAADVGVEGRAATRGGEPQGADPSLDARGGHACEGRRGFVAVPSPASPAERAGLRTDHRAGRSEPRRSPRGSPRFRRNGPRVYPHRPHAPPRRRRPR